MEWTYFKTDGDFTCYTKLCPTCKTPVYTWALTGNDRYTAESFRYADNLLCEKMYGVWPELGRKIGGIYIKRICHPNVPVLASGAPNPYYPDGQVDLANGTSMTWEEARVALTVEAAL